MSFDRLRTRIGLPPYLLKYIAPATAGTAGSGWLKIAEEGFTNGKARIYVSYAQIRGKR